MSFDDGVPINAEFTVESLISGEVINYTESDFTQLGVLETSLLPGPYSVSVNYSTADQQDASDFNNFFQTKTIFIDPLNQEIQNVSIGFSDEYLFTGKLIYPNGDNASAEYLLYNELENEWFSVQTDSNGNFS